MHVKLVDLLWEGHHTPYVTLLSRYFTERGHDVTFVTDVRNERLDEIPDFERLTIETHDIAQTPSNPSDLQTSVREQYVRTQQLNDIFKTAGDADVDIVHLLFFDRMQIPFRVMSLRHHTDTPVIATLHRDAFLSSSGGITMKRVTRLATTLALNSLFQSGNLNALTVHADSLRDRIIGGVDAATRENTLTVPAPTPDYKVDASRDELRERLGLPRDKELLLFFGGLRKEKGPDVLAEYVRGLDRSLAVVYAGSPVDYTEDDVANWKHHIDPPVKIVDHLGYIPEADVNAYFAAVDALALPYRRTRGISGPLRRAAAVGTPSVGRADSDVGDLIEQHRLGTTFDLEDQEDFERGLARVLDAHEGAYTESLEAFAESRHWTASGERFLEIYRDVQ